MVTFLLISLKRSWLTHVLIGLLYTLSYLQLSFYYYFDKAGFFPNPLVKGGYQLGVLGFFAGTIGVIFILARQLRFEMGNLETLGFSQHKYVLFYLIQTGIIFLLAVIAGIVGFIIAYQSIEFKSVQLSVLFEGHLSTTWQLASLYLSANFLFYYFHSYKDPMLLIKDKI